MTEMVAITAKPADRQATGFFDVSVWSMVNKGFD
jgi:hypothetical protein